MASSQVATYSTNNPEVSGRTGVVRALQGLGIRMETKRSETWGMSKLEWVLTIAILFSTPPMVSTKGKTGLLLGYDLELGNLADF